MLENYQRQELYGFFARIFSYPDHSLIEDLSAKLAATADLLSVSSAHLNPLPDLVELQTGYTQLFIGPSGSAPAPPYGSVYLEKEGRLMGQTTLYVLRAYEGEGLNHEKGGEPADFIATEMEFLSFLVEQEIDALSSSDLSAAQVARQKQIDFCHTLLQPWIKQFCQRVLLSESATELYRWSAETLIEFCQHEEELYGVS